jgi:hypothetical protein
MTTDHDQTLQKLINSSETERRAKDAEFKENLDILEQ